MRLLTTTGELIIEREVATMKELVEIALSENANLQRANLRGANLRGANLRGANLRDADLRGVDLRDANLRGVNLRGADLRGVNLRGANLRGANLRDANLRGANLRDADFRDADLRGVNLRGANLRGANLRDADLRGVDLRDANLRGVNLRGADLRGVNLRGADLQNARLPDYQICPEEGAFIAWKKGRNECLIKLEIPAEAKRNSCLTSRKCRAEYAKVLAIEDKRGKRVKECWGCHDLNFIYTVGETVIPDKYNADPRIECSNGIHFFITRKEAEEFYIY